MRLLFSRPSRPGHGLCEVNCADFSVLDKAIGPYLLGSRAGNQMECGLRWSWILRAGLVKVEAAQKDGAVGDDMGMADVLCHNLPRFWCGYGALMFIKYLAFLKDTTKVERCMLRRRGHEDRVMLDCRSSR